MPGLRGFEVQGAVYHDAGATPAQEIAAALAAGVAYLRALDSAGLPIARAARHVAFAFATDADFFASIAKLRAFRRAWARVLAASGVGDAVGGSRLAAVTSRRMMTARDPHTNLLRTTIAASAAIVGGADAVTVLPFTERLGDSGLARRLARNIPQILMEEADLARVEDPAGGAFAVERLTEDLAHEAWSAFQEIEREGGLGASLLAGKLQSRIAASAAARRAQVDAGTLPIIGVTRFPPSKEAPLELDPPQRLAVRAPTHEALKNVAARPRISAAPLPVLYDDAAEGAAR